MEHPKLMGVEIQRQSCGRTAVENDARAFWQSRVTKPGQRAEPIQLADLRGLALAIRSAYT